MQENRFDSIFEQLLEEAAITESKEFENSLLEPEEDFEMSAEGKERMEKLFKKERKSRRVKKMICYGKRAACIAVAAIVVSSVAVFSVEAWRIRFFNFMFNPDNPGMEYNFNDERSTHYSDEYIALNYLPVGFELTEQDISRRSITLMFQKGEEYFSVKMHSMSGNSSVDTENGTIENIKINGHNAIYTTNPNINCVIWHNDEVAFRVLGNINKEKLVKIAESIIQKHTF